MNSAPAGASILVLVNLATASTAAGLALLAQVNWSLWRHVGPAEFPAFHLAWWHSIWWSIFPVGAVGFAGIVAQLIWRPLTPAWMLWLALTLQLLGYAGTALWWGPGQSRLKQARLPDGRLDPAYVLYLNTNWIRVAIFAAAALLQLWIALVHFSAWRR
jgi:hypothetical protein